MEVLRNQAVTFYPLPDEFADFDYNTYITNNCHIVDRQFCLPVQDGDESCFQFKARIFSGNLLRLTNASGSSTSVGTNELNDSTAQFQTVDLIRVNELVSNLTAGCSSRILTVNSETQLGLNIDCFTNIGENYVTYRWQSDAGTSWTANFDLLRFDKIPDIGSLDTELYQDNVFEAGNYQIVFDRWYKLTFEIVRYVAGSLNIYFGTNLIGSVNQLGTYTFYGKFAGNDSVRFQSLFVDDFDGSISMGVTLEKVNSFTSIRIVDKETFEIVKEIQYEETGDSLSIGNISYCVDWQLLDIPEGCYRIEITDCQGGNHVAAGDFESPSPNTGWAFPFAGFSIITGDNSSKVMRIDSTALTDEYTNTTVDCNFQTNEQYVIEYDTVKGDKPFYFSTDGNTPIPGDQALGHHIQNFTVTSGGNEFYIHADSGVAGPDATQIDNVKVYQLPETVEPFARSECYTYKKSPLCITAEIFEYSPKGWVKDTGIGIDAGKLNFDTAADGNGANHVSNCEYVPGTYTIEYDISDYVSGDIKFFLGGEEVTGLLPGPANGHFQITYTVSNLANDNILRVESSVAGTTLKIYNINVSVQVSTIPLEFIKDCHRCGDGWECTTVLRFSDEKNVFGNYAPDHNIRVPCRLKNAKMQDDEFTEFKNSLGFRKMGYASISEVVELYIEPVPPYVHKAIAQALKHRTFYFDKISENYQFVPLEEYQPNYGDESELANCTVKLAKVNQRDTFNTY